MSAAQSDPADPISPAGIVYQAITDKLLAAEYDRRKSLESRAAALLGSSGTMLAVIFGLTVLITGKDAVYRNAFAIAALIAAMVFFIASGIVALVVQAYGYEYKVMSAAALTSLARDDSEWARRADDATRHWVAKQASTVCTMRRGNSKKARQIEVSLGLQVVAIVLLSISAGVELVGRL